MVSRMQPHEHVSGASHPMCSSLTCAVCAVLCVVKRGGWRQPPPTLIGLTRSVTSSHSLPPAHMQRRRAFSHTLLCSCAAALSCNHAPSGSMPRLRSLEAKAQQWQQMLLAV